MKSKDLQIIAQLRNDARMPLTIMSKKIRVPVSTIFDRLKLHEGDLITKHTSLLNFTKLGYNSRANIMLKVDRECKDAIKEYLLKHPSVNSLYKINNGFDFMAEGVFRQIKDTEDFIDDLEKKFKVLDKNVFFIIDDVKREAFMNDSNLIFEEE
jgi:DNA-binding Lrp family transcriptional regulator